MSLATFTEGYTDAIHFAELGPDDKPLDWRFEFSAPAEQRIANDCLAFYSAHNERFNYGRGREDDAYAGHDFWLTRAGHGAGFWDGDLAPEDGDALTAATEAIGACEVYVGDDQLLYFA